MTKNIKYNSLKLLIVRTIPFLGLMLFMTSALVANAATLSRTLDLGMSGSDVSSLQTYLASDANIYPSGLVSGYFGQLTKAAVERFQTSEGIVHAGTPATTGYGRVGPNTLEAFNQKMGGISVGSAGEAPSISPLSISTTNTSATINWTTNENASAIVYYSTSPLPMTEASANTPVFIGGSSFLVHTDLRTSHSATLTNLIPNTMYYYVVYVRDGLGNESITWPTTFNTTQ